MLVGVFLHCLQNGTHGKVVVEDHLHEILNFVRVLLLEAEVHGQFGCSFEILLQSLLDLVEVLFTNWIAIVLPPVSALMAFLSCLPAARRKVDVDRGR